MAINLLLLISSILLGAISLVIYIKYDDERNRRLFLLGKIQPYKKVRSLLTSNEKKLYRILLALPSLKDFYIYPQIPYSSILTIEPKYRDLKGSFEEINRLRADFVVFSKDNFMPVLVVELNDLTHFWDNRSARDIFVKSALKSSNLPLLTLKIIDINQLEKLNNLILEKLSVSNDRTSS